MSKFKRYIFNPETLTYEVKERSARARFFKGVLLFAASLGMAVLYAWIYTSVLGCDLPKTMALEKTNTRWNLKMDERDSG